MAELENAQPPDQESTQAPKEEKPSEKTTTVNLKFSLTKKKKIILGISGVLLICLAAFLTIWFTDLKYSVLGVFFKAEAQIVVADSKTLQPIEGAEAKLGDQTQKTDQKGVAHFKNLILGRKTLKVRKETYKDFQREETIFIGGNKLKPVKLVGAGIPISFVVKNKITDLAIAGAEVKVGKNKVKTAKDGAAVIMVLPQADVKAAAKISKNGYVDASSEFKVEQNLEPFPITLTPEGKNYFLSNRSGQIDLYESNLDGTKQKVILAATGSENESTSINVSPDNKWTALISTREAVKGASGELIPILYLVKPKDKSLTKISSAVHHSIIGWIGDTLIYSTDNRKYDDNHEEKLFSYNAVSTKKTTIEKTSGYISGKEIIGDNLIYSLTEKTVKKYGLFATSADGSSERKIFEGTVYSVYQKTNSSLVFQSSDSNKWYLYDLNSSTITQLPSKPPSLKSKGLVASPSGLRTAFVESRDGKYELYLADAQGSKEKKKTSLGSVSYPIRWVGEDYVIFRYARDDETADYILGRKGGNPLKIVDVYTPNSYYGH